MHLVACTFRPTIFAKPIRAGPNILLNKRITMTRLGLLKVMFI